MPTIQARYWLLTIPVAHLPVFPEPSGNYVYAKGQQEIGANGLHHWQAFAQFDKKVTLAQCKGYFCEQAHCEQSRSTAAELYVWKEDTRVHGSQFEKGSRPMRRNVQTDWDDVLSKAKAGNIDDIPADILVRYYNSIKRIRVDYCEPVWRHDINVKVFWGRSGTGKTRRAWHEAGELVYVKDPNTKWWDGYRGQENVIIDEFTGVIAINHILRWLDRYPCFAEVKGYQTPLRATNFWITSNIDPRLWYSEASDDQKEALRRRCQITHFLGEWIPPPPNDENRSDGEVYWDNGPTFIDLTESTDVLDFLSGKF